MILVNLSCLLFSNTNAKLAVIYSTLFYLFLFDYCFITTQEEAWWSPAMAKYLSRASKFDVLLGNTCKTDKRKRVNSRKNLLETDRDDFDVERFLSLVNRWIGIIARKQLATNLAPITGKGMKGSREVSG